MSRNYNTRSASPGRGMSLLAGILIGMVLGLIVAAGMAWYILKTPSAFVNNVPREDAKLVPDTVKPAPAAATSSTPQPASGVGGDGKPRFEFYKVLTDKQEATPPAPAQPSRPVDKPAARETYFLQAGAFSSAEEADKLKAKLAMLGMEAAVQDATLADKTIHRVRLGPYKNEDDMKKMLATLKQNGIEATPMRVQ
jgi:cell division protein FtsN